MNTAQICAKSIFLEAVELSSAAEWAAYLDQQCGDDAELHREVEELLLHHGNVKNFLESPPTVVIESADQIRTFAPQSLSLRFLEPTSRSDSLGRLGHYEILEVIGSGGMGIVLKAFDEKLHRTVAIKAMAPSLAASDTGRQRFVREAQAAAAVNHDNIVDIYAVEETGPVPYLVMEFIAGVSLEDRLGQSGALDSREILRIGLQTADALAAAHGQGLVHRDVKPANILLENGVGRVKITDFGLACAADDVTLTQTGIVAGTPVYMSPEQARGDAVDHRSDLFSLGSVLYEMCTGRSPFRAGNTMAVLHRVCNDTPPPIGEANADIPASLTAIVDRLLAKEPDERYQSAAQMAELLGQCLAHLQNSSVVGEVSLPDAAETADAKPVPRRRIWAVIAAAVILLFSGLSLTEATGVTHLAATVVRIATGEGTLVVEVDDPAVKVTIEGDGGLVITEPGAQEVRLRPGSYKVQAAKDGKPVGLDRELVTISRGGKQIVRVSLESRIAAASADAPGEVRRFVGHTQGVQSVAISFDGRRIVSGSDDKTVRLWDLNTGKELRKFEGHSDKVYSVAFSPDGSRVLSGSFEMTVRLWDVATGKELRRFSGHTDKVACVAYSPDGRRALSGGNDNTMRLWDVESGEELRRFEGLSRPLYSVAFAPDGRRALSGGWDKTMRLWDVETGKELRRFEGHTDVVKSVAFSPDGRRALSAGGTDKTVRLWDLETGEELRRFEGHRLWAHSVAFTPDGLRAVSSGTHFVYLWDVQSGRLLQTFPGHTGEVASVAVSPDARLALSAGWNGDNALRLWQLPEASSGKAVQAERGALVLLGGKGVAERKFDTLAEAVQSASDGDTIEVRGNGPFVCDPVKITQALTIRAGEGFRPVINLTVAPEPLIQNGLESASPLVLEGLEFRVLDPHKRKVHHCAVAASNALRVANCRFSTAFMCLGDYSTSPLSVWEVRNCEFLGSHHDSRAVGRGFSSGQKLTLENCVSTLPCTVGVGTHEPKVPCLQFTRNTFRTNATVEFMDDTDKSRNANNSNQKGEALLVKASGNVFDSSRVLVFTQIPPGKILSPPDAEHYLAQVVGWKGETNLYAIADPFLTLWTSEKGQQNPAKPIKTLEDWKQFWTTAEDNSIEGLVRFHGGDLLAKVKLSPEKITPEDFRLRPDSPGYKAGTDGKDLGADVDLVGPGPAYERWKKTPEYQAWLKDTGQLQAEAPKPEPKAFVVLTGKGVEVRKFDKLADAVQGASDGDTIEIRGNGPFVMQPITIGKTALTIRAADGFRPVIKLSPDADQADVPLLGTNAALVLEGLELYRAPREKGGGRLLEVNRAPVRAANCRFRSSLGVNYAPVCVFRNCEFLAKTANIVAMCGPGARVVFENCLHRTTGSAIGIGSFDVELHDVVIQIKGSTLVNEHRPFWLPLRSPSPSDPPQASQPVRLEVSGSIFDAPAVLGFDTVNGFDRERTLREEAALLEPPEAEAALLRLLDWHGERNLYAADSTWVTWTAAGKQQRSHGPKSLEEWTRFWGAAETGSLQGHLRFQGGNLLSRPEAALDQLTPDDFRLREDSPGYRAGKDSKDLGADVDLVGPGPAYERWKQTPEYQEWLKETGQKE